MQNKLGVALLTMVLVATWPLRALAASDALYLPNLGGNATGTTSGAKRLLDVNLSFPTSDGDTFVPGSAGLLTLGVSNEANSSLGAANNELIPLTVDQTGRLRVDATISEAATAADGGALPAVVKVSGGYDGTNVQVFKTDATGSMQVDVESSALPTGASTAANQATANASLSSIDGKVPANLTVTSTRLLVDGSGVTQPVSAASLPLPTGAATEATLSTLNGKVTAVDTDDVTITSSALPTGASTEATLAAASAKLPATLGQKAMAASMAVVVASDQSAIPVSQSGTWNVNNISGTVSLPTGAATEATLSTLNGKVSSDFGAASGGVRVNAQIGNASGAADFNAGNVGAQTPRVVLASDQPTVSVAQAAPTAKTVKQAAITVGTSAVRLTHDGSAPDADRVYLAFRPDDANTGICYWGSSSVASSGGSRGMKIFNAESVELKLDAGDYYAICDTAAQTFWVVEQE